MPTIAVLGSTGVIGSLALEVISGLGDDYRLLGLAAKRNDRILAEQIRAYRPTIVAVGDSEAAERLAGALPADIRPQIEVGAEAVERLAGHDEVDVVVNAITGAAGLKPTLTAVAAGKRIALANKESLVMAGEIVMAEARRTGAEILPVDSEHSAIFQAARFCRQGGGATAEIGRAVLTASGGPFYGWSTSKLKHITPTEAMRHPTWRMGPKISIDSATLMNKAMEVVEARHLFDLPVEKISVLIHPQSIVHSLIEYVDGSMIAQLGPRDMRLPIQFALTYPTRNPAVNGCERLDLTRAGGLLFYEPDLERFPALELGFEVARRGGTLGAVFNAADEEAVAAFRDARIHFTDIVPIVRKVMESHEFVANPTLNQILEADELARRASPKFSHPGEGPDGPGEFKDA